MKKLSALLVLLLALVLPLSSACGKSGMSEEEIRNIYRELIEASYELNDVYYGSGLPCTEDEQILETLLGFSPEAEGVSVYYLPVTEDAAFASQAEIEEATRAVFSEEMCAILFEIAFSGVSTEDEEKVAFARYIEQEGYLTVRIDLADTALPLGRTYDFDSMTVLINETNRLRAEFPTFVDGAESLRVSLTLVKTADGWRLDSPTY